MIVNLKYIPLVGGIYIIINNNKVYVGSSNCMRKRVREHYMKLLSNKHLNKHLQNSWNLDNSNFVFDYLEICENAEDRIKAESSWIETFKSYIREYGYNISRNPAKVIISEETKEKLREYRIGRKMDRDIVERIREANTGQKREIQSIKMKTRWEADKKLFGIHTLVGDKRKEALQRLSIARKERLKNDNNIIDNHFVRLEINGEVYNFRSFVKASKFINVDKKTIRNNIGRIIKKRGCRVTLLTREEYFENPVSGEK